jgi:hypothetical protein
MIELVARDGGNSCRKSVQSYLSVSGLFRRFGPE